MKHIPFRPASGMIGLLALMAVGWQASHTVKNDPPAKTHGPIAWTDSLAKARKTAQRQKKPIFVDFYAEWCGPCQEMLHTTYQDKQVVARSRQFVPVLVNVDKQPKLAEKYNVQALPTIVFLNAKGDVLRQEIGYHDAKEFLQITAAVLKQAAPTKRDTLR